MKKSNELDAVCIEKILKYIRVINELYETYNITDPAGLKSNLGCQLAITQAITNIYE